jgi:hypothetical protein
MDGYFDGYEIVKTILLPYRPCYSASDLATKEQILVQAESEIHCFVIGSTLYVSDQLYVKLKRKYEKS